MSTQASLCSICGKQLQGGVSSIKRHERYCQKKLVQPLLSRRKACHACIHAKTRCDFHRPSCGSCQLKGKDCLYPNDQVALGNPAVSGSQLQFKVRNRSARGKRASSLYSSSSAIELDVLSTPVIAQSSSSSLPSDSTVRKPTKDTVPAEAPERAFLPQTEHTQSPPASLSLLQPKVCKQGRGAPIERLICHIICSYSERRMTETSLPPFIHRSPFLRSINSEHGDNPIVVCQSITRKFCVRHSLNCFTVWDDITVEQERIYVNRASFDKWLHLSSAQAITVYLLMVAAEGGTVLKRHPTLPVTLLYTLGVIFGELNRIHPGYVTVEEENGGRPIWEDWVFAESKLRTALIYFLFSLYFDVDFSLPCDRSGDSLLEEMELPAAAALWQAENEKAWRDEFDLGLPTRNHFMDFHELEPRLRYGDLMRFNEHGNADARVGMQQNSTWLAARIERWQRGMDELGTLVALTGT